MLGLSRLLVASDLHFAGRSVFRPCSQACHVTEIMVKPRCFPAPCQTSLSVCQSSRQLDMIWLPARITAGRSSCGRRFTHINDAEACQASVMLMMDVSYFVFCLPLPTQLAVLLNDLIFCLTVRCVLFLSRICVISHMSLCNLERKNDPAFRYSWSWKIFWFWTFFIKVHQGGFLRLISCSSVTRNRLRLVIKWDQKAFFVDMLVKGIRRLSWSALSR